MVLCEEGVGLWKGGEECMGIRKGEFCGVRLIVEWDCV